ncbi:MAG: dihydrolipoyl dehydrogenase [Candidatus Dormibacteraeota bacterium]|jgi:dihydrolipoamide dehydrogenase|nr:dihydrolipoyl dehydrogenase [Candidatus Dormibacteraeota bacterium]
MREFDTITIGAGGGAYPAAFRLARAGHKVAMVDVKGVLSGNCLAEGCVPSKAVREVAATYHRMTRAAAMGLSGALEVSYEQVLAHKTRVQTLRYQQHDLELAASSEQLQLIKGRASLLDPHTVEVHTDGAARRLTAATIIVASGSDISIPPIPGADLCITSRDLFALDATLKDLPRRLVIVGAGYIGLEVASMLHTFGVSVEVLEMTDQILPGMDPRFAQLLASLLDPGIVIRLGARVARIDRSAAGLVVSYSTTDGPATSTADQVLLAVGRHPVLPDGLSEAGITVASGRPLVNPALQTNLPHVYATGDVNGLSMLFHSAVRQSLTASTSILNGNHASDSFDPDAVPTTIFTMPEAAYVGLLPARAAAAGVPLVESAYSFTEDSRAQIMDDTGGEIRLFFAPQSLRLLGGWVVGIDAANLIGEIGTSVAAGLTAHQLARFSDQHPMASEGIGKSARQLV